MGVKGGGCLWNLTVGVAVEFCEETLEGEGNVLKKRVRSVVGNVVNYLFNCGWVRVLLGKDLMELLWGRGGVYAKFPNYCVKCGLKINKEECLWCLGMFSNGLEGGKQGDSEVSGLMW